MRGQVSVRNGRALVEDPPEGGKPATITPSPGIRLFVNGEEILKTTPVCSSDEILLEPQTDSTPGTLEVTVDAERMMAWVKARPDLTVSRTVLDHPPVSDLVLQTQPVTSTSFPWTTPAVVAFLREKGITFGILDDDITAFLEQGSEGQVLAAKGRPPSLPTDEKVVVLFETKGTGKPTVREDGTVDYKDLQLFSSVSEGALLGVKSQAVPGTPGTTVTGETVPAPEPKRYVLQPGRNTEVAPDGLAIKAIAGGRPEVHQADDTYRFEIVPVLEHYSNVDLRTGNISFKGDVKVTGLVAEGMAVKADGQIRITGTVSGAVIQSERGVVIDGHVFSSEIRAGTHLAKYLAPVTQLASEYTQALAACRQLLQRAAEAGQSATAGQMFLLLLDHRFRTLPGQVNQLREMIANTRKANLWLPPNLEKPIDVLAQQFLGIEVVSLQTVKPLETVLHQLQDARAELEQLSQQQYGVELASVANSLVETTGNVKIGTRGSYNSRIHAGGDVRIDGNLKGGLVQAKGDVYVATAGSQRAAAETKIQTVDGKRVKLDLVYPGVIIHIEHRTIRVKQPTRNATARLYADSVDLTGSPVR
ncbi:MAG: DUF342 domain-containing protein [Candidatus Desulforudis sp.]|nr:DUF342 domain-containing protein [Desulforudis sp.]